jgi:diguanylate cyclase
LKQHQEKPTNETDRLNRLKELNVLDSAPEAIFDTIAKLASDICGVEIAAISLIDEDRQWFKSMVGCIVETPIPRAHAFCAHTILHNTLFEVEDAKLDARFSQMPLVKHSPNVRFYAGTPLALYGDLNIGTLSVMDKKPQKLLPLQRKLLVGLADIAKNALLVREAAMNEMNMRSNKLAVIVQSSEDAIISKTLDDIVTTWNEAATKLFGFSAQEMIGQSISRLIPNDKRDEAEFLMRQLKNGLNIQHFETQYLDQNGRVIEVAISLSAIKNPQGQVMEISEIIRDITLQKTMQKTIVHEHALLKVTMDSIGDGVLTTDQQGFVQYLNPVAQHLTGWTTQEAIGQPLAKVFNVVNEQTRQSVEDPVNICLIEDRLVNVADQSVLIRRDGVEFGVEETASPIRDNEGEAIGVVIVFHDVSEQRKIANEISYRASHDLLTGLANRSEFEDGLKRFVNNNRMVGQMHALMFIDLDRFKVINDACGHAAGDFVLKEVAKIIKSCVRSSDLVARIGGDEFAIILRKCETEKSMNIAKTICKLVSEYRFYHEANVFEIGASIGLVIINASWESEAKLLKAADSACYQAKREGRNRVHVYYDEDIKLDSGQVEIQWASRIEQALEEESFVLFCQRIMPLNHEGLEHAEILIRMKDKSGDLIPPSDFFPAAERFNMASRIDKWVVKAVFEWMKANAKSIDHIESLSVNLSGQSLGDLAFHHFVIDLITTMQVDCSKLCFEVTETSAITNITDAKIFINAMHHLGVKFSLDDFGSGFSSFGYLKNLSVDYLKIDGQFIRDLLENKVGQATVRCITEVARATGKQTIAEWVDNAPVENMLKSMGVDFTQGYLKHKPAPLSFMLETNCSYVVH